MARARSWFTMAQASGSMGETALQGAHTIASDLVDPTLLRTRAFAALSYAGDDVPAYYPGNAASPQVLRVLVGDAASPPDSTWPGETEGPEDVIFHPLVWGSGLYVPASADMSRPEKIYQIAAVAGGVADSAGQRHMPGTVNVLVSWYVGPSPGSGSFADPDTTVNLWIRCLIEATI